MSEDRRMIKDIEAVIGRFPKLKSRRNNEHEAWIIEGDLDICDTQGVYWDTFEIVIILDKKYPFSVPIVIERSTRVPREDDRHISKSGVCCLDIDHRLLRLATRGINLLDFITTKVYPFFANQLYFEEKGCYAGEEYAHRFKGVEQFYNHELNINTPEMAASFLELMISNKIPERNALCPCGSKTKYKKCHQSAIEFLAQVGKERLKEDLVGFKKLMPN